MSLPGRGRPGTSQQAELTRVRRGYAWTTSVLASALRHNGADRRQPQDCEPPEQRGAAYVFTRSGTDWTQKAELRDPNAASGDVFGESVRILG